MEGASAAASEAWNLDPNSAPRVLDDLGQVTNISVGVSKS